MDSLSGALLGFVLAFLLIPQLYIMMALGTPVFSGILGYRVARRVSDSCIVRAGGTAFFAICVPLLIYGIATAYLSERSLIQNLMTTSAFLLKVPPFLFARMYDYRTYEDLALIVSSAVMLPFVWGLGATLCRMRRRSSRKS